MYAKAKHRVWTKYDWQKRCEAAEKVINALLNNSDTDENIQEYSEWQQLKSLPVK